MCLSYMILHTRICINNPLSPKWHFSATLIFTPRKNRTRCVACVCLFVCMSVCRACPRDNSSHSYIHFVWQFCPRLKKKERWLRHSWSLFIQLTTSKNMSQIWRKSQYLHRRSISVDFPPLVKLGKIDWLWPQGYYALNLIAYIEI